MGQCKGVPGMVWDVRMVSWGKGPRAVWGDKQDKMDRYEIVRR